MDIKIDGIEYVNTRDGGYFREYTRTETIDDSKKRHKLLCTMCGFSTYPKCREWCPNGK